MESFANFLLKVNEFMEPDLAPEIRARRRKAHTAGMAFVGDFNRDA